MTGERGSITLAHVYAVALSLVLFTVVTNLVVHQYGHGVLRATVDEAARIGARTAGTAEVAAETCEHAARHLGGTLLAGRLGEDLSVACTADGGRVTAVARARFAGWFAFVPDWEVEVVASALQEGGG